MKRGVLLYFFVVTILSCTNKPVHEDGGDKNLPFEASGITPNADTLKKPVVVSLDTCPPPAAMPADGKQSTYIVKTKKGSKAYPVIPPVIKPADFYVPMVNYTAEQGLYSSISTIFKDNNGNLWFGTNGGGVSCYNGKTFTNFTVAQGLANSVITSIAEDKDGNMWFATEDGACRYNGKSFYTFTKANGLPDNNIGCIVKSRKGNLWFGTPYEGVYCYDGKTFTNITKAQGLVNNTVLSICEDRNGFMWFGTDGGVSCYNGEKFTNYTTKDGLANNYVKAIMQDKNGNIWFGTRGGVSCYDGKKISSYTKEDGLCDDVVTSIAEDRNNDIWFGTSGGGVSRYNGKSFTTYSVAQGLANNAINSIALDGNGNLWFGTDAGGASRYDGDAITTYTTAQGLNNNIVFSITQAADSSFWFGTLDAGVDHYDGKTFTAYTLAHDNSDNSVEGILPDKKGNLWFATSGGAVKYDGKYFTTYTTAQGLVFVQVECLCLDKEGKIWFGTRGGGVSCFDGKTFTNYTTAQGLCGNSIYSVAKDDNGNLWFGTDGGGASRYDGKTFTTFNASQGLTNNSILSIWKDKSGNMWFGSDGGGVSRYDGKSFSTFTTMQGLSNNGVFGICEDSKGTLWFGTNEGFTSLKGFIHSGAKNARTSDSLMGDNKLSNLTLAGNYTPVFEKYNFKNGYPIRDVNTHALIIDNKGIIWAGTGDRLVRFDYKSIHKSPEPPKIAIQSVKLRNEDICWYDLENRKQNKGLNKEDSLAAVNEEVQTFGDLITPAQKDSMRKKFAGVEFSGITPFNFLPEHLVLPYDQNNVTFEFAAIAPAKSNLVRYQHILEGYDDKWSPVTDKTTAVFGNIHEGTYTFMLKGQSADGVWSAPVSYTFKVLPPWYRSWWAYTLYLICFMSVLYVLYEWRTTQLRKDKEHLEQVVADRTAEVMHQKVLVEEKNKDIMDSITYAKRLQDAILPPTEQIKEFFPQSFVMYKPKDIVAGDFYWMDKQGDTILLAACDCTGHGVPGAMVSVVCSNALNRALKEFKIKETGKLLDQTRELVIETFEKSHSNVNDGMDISFCAINTKEKRLEWSGANNPLWYIRNNELKEIEPDKQSISKQDGKKPFTTKSLQLEKDDVLYLFTDGYADQFGGPKGKKFKYRQLMETLLSNCKKPLEEQRKVLENKFAEWKGSLEQVDDVLIVGIRI